jgi:AraC-like DNA-binding protein
MTIGWVALAGTELEQMLNILHFPQEFSTTISYERIEAIEQLFIKTVYSVQDTDSLPFLMLGNFFVALSMANINYQSPQTTMNVHITKAYQYINMHYSEDISVESIADYLHISESRLRGLFATEMKISPHRAIIEKRMSVAKTLMQSESPPNIQTIAQMCGYFDQGAFSKRFQKETGLTPSEYIQSVACAPIKPNQ